MFHIYLKNVHLFRYNHLTFDYIFYLISSYNESEISETNMLIFTYKLHWYSFRWKHFLSVNIALKSFWCVLSIFKYLLRVCFIQRSMYLQSERRKNLWARWWIRKEATTGLPCLNHFSLLIYSDIFSLIFTWKSWVQTYLKVVNFYYDNVISPFIRYEHVDCLQEIHSSECDSVLTQWIFLYWCYFDASVKKSSLIYNFLVMISCVLICRCYWWLKSLGF